MNALLRALGRIAFAVLPKHSALLYRLAKRYVDRFHGNNQLDMRTNGELVFMQQQLPHARLVFDVGAATGDWAAHALAINPALDLHCFEPNPASFARLAALNLHARVNPFAIGDANGEAVLHASVAAPQLGSLYERSGVDIPQNGTHQAILIRTLDDYCAEHGIASVDFVKLDVEGHEAAVIRGMEALLGARAVRVIQFEYGGANIDARVLLKDLWATLSRHGYRLWKLFPEGPRRYERYTQELEDFQYQNWAAILENE
ncbi:MAG TPA: FkbM family methyltransferase [Thermoanaerobaculia bacterium]|nr:FkbM family methyltransferase [Thermoanaerobaculia bacterium]